MESEKKESSLSVPIAIIVSGIIIAGAVFLTRNPIASELTGANVGQAVPPVDVPAISSDDHILGNPDAPLVFIEYSDTECPFCKDFHATMLEIMDEFGPTGEVAWVYRHFPLDELHPRASREAAATECARELGGASAFWEFTNKLFEMKPVETAGFAHLTDLAGEVGVGGVAFETCLSSGKYDAQIEESRAEAERAGGQGTPFTVIRTAEDDFPLGGAYPYETVREIVVSYLEQQRTQGEAPAVVE